MFIKGKLEKNAAGQVCEAYKLVLWMLRPFLIISDYAGSGAQLSPLQVNLELGHQFIYKGQAIEKDHSCTDSSMPDAGLIGHVFVCL